MKKGSDVQSMAKIALCATLLVVASYPVIPLPFTPIVFSVHTVMVNLIGLLLKPKHAAYTIIVYLLMGLIGLPVFSGGTAGTGKLFGPTGGFYFGFLAAVVLISLFKGNRSDFFRYALVTIFLGIPAQHLFAILFMCFYNGFNIKAAVTAASLPFIPGDILKCLIASAIGAAVNKILRKQPEKEHFGRLTRGC